MVWTLFPVYSLAVQAFTVLFLSSELRYALGGGWRGHRATNERCGVYRWDDV